MLKEDCEMHGSVEGLLAPAVPTRKAAREPSGSNASKVHNKSAAVCGPLRFVATPRGLNSIHFMDDLQKINSS